MSNIEDVGIIFYTKKHKGDSLVAKIITKSNNVVTGIVFNALNKTNFCKNQVGNYVHFFYSKENENRLGVLSIDLIKSNSEIFFQKKENIAIINLVIFFLNFLLIENNNTELLYKKFFNLVFSIKNNVNYIILYYIDFVFSLFEYLGLNLNPYFCIITGDKNTYYISPKTGNAVTKSVGDKYKDKLFLIPKCFKEFVYEKDDILNALNIMFFFLQKFIKENNLFYLKKDFAFLSKTLVFIVKSSNFNF